MRGLNANSQGLGQPGQNYNAASDLVLKQELCSLPTSGLRISRSLSVRACPEFVCCAIYNSIKIFWNLSAKTLPQSSCYLPKDRRASESAPQLPCPHATNPAMLGHCRTSSSQNTPALAASLLSPSSSLLGHAFPCSLCIHLLFPSLGTVPSKQGLS